MVEYSKAYSQNTCLSIHKGTAKTQLSLCIYNVLIYFRHWKHILHIYHLPFSAVTVSSGFGRTSNPTSPEGPLPTIWDPPPSAPCGSALLLLSGPGKSSVDWSSSLDWVSWLSSSCFSPSSSTGSPGSTISVKEMH